MLVGRFKWDNTGTKLFSIQSFEEYGKYVTDPSVCINICYRLVIDILPKLTQVSQNTEYNGHQRVIHKCSGVSLFTSILLKTLYHICVHSVDL